MPRVARATLALLLVAPGWVRTDLGGAEASPAGEESIPLVVDTIAANHKKPGLSVRRPLRQRAALVKLEHAAPELSVACDKPQAMPMPSVTPPRSSARRAGRMRRRRSQFFNRATPSKASTR